MFPELQSIDIQSLNQKESLLAEMQPFKVVALFPFWRGVEGVRGVEGGKLVLGHRALAWQSRAKPSPELAHHDERKLC